MGRHIRESGPKGCVIVTVGQDVVTQMEQVFLDALRWTLTQIDLSDMEDPRDQLYLALRIATLERHLKKGEPMPFVVDDILIGFDDHRTRVCLEVLAQLSRRAQVLVFTHHRRVIELADTCNDTDKIFQHDLS